jgi:hypothetical protein
MTHPNAYSADEQGFLDGLRHTPTPIPNEAFERLNELLGRVPSYEIGDDGMLDYDRPVVLNQRFTDPILAERGFENVVLYGRTFVRLWAP